MNGSTSMPGETPALPMPKQSLRRKLPVLISLLLTLAVAAVSWTAYHSVRGALLEALTRDLTTAAHHLTTNLEQSVRRTRDAAHALASEPEVAALLGASSGTSRAAVEAALRARQEAAGERLLAVAVWDRQRRPVLRVGAPPSASEQLARADFTGIHGPATDTLAAFRFLVDGEAIALGVLAPVLGSTRAEGMAPDTLGFVAEYRAILGGGQVPFIRGLIGPQAQFAVGNPERRVWTNLERPVIGPTEPTPPGTLVRTTSARQAVHLGIMTPIAGTSWHVWVDMPERIVMAPARGVLRTILGIALAVIALGALGAWLVSRGITHPLAEVAQAAHGITTGDYSRRAAVQRTDEIGVLAGSFNSMADRIESTTHSLEQQKVELEYQVLQSQELAQELESTNEELTDVLRAIEESRDAIATAARRYQLLVENATDLIAVVDRRGFFLYASPAHERVFGSRVGSLVGTSSLERVFPEDRDVVESAIARAIRQPGLPVAVNYRFRHADGSWRHIEAYGVSLLNDPAIGGIVVNSRDVTAQQRLERQLLHAQKMEAVGRFAGGVAHDFNNILTAIKSYSQLALESLSGTGSSANDDLREIDRATDRAATLIRQLLAFSRQQVLQPIVLDLNTTIRGMESMLRRMLMTDVELHTELTPELGHIEADPGQIEQVLMNLVVNARDAMPEGGRITIRTANGDGMPAAGADPQEHPTGPCVMLSVSDTGEGMSAETQARIFEPFFTTKDQGRGTGLGLSTVYGIVQQSGGQISVSSEPGRGTTFTIALPRIEVTAEHAVPRSSGMLDTGGPERILIVEDDPVVRSLACRVLSRVGYDVLEAENGREALRVLEQHASTVSLVISDVIMPEMRGTELLAEIRSRYATLPVLLVSGYSEDGVTRNGLAESRASFLEKPFTPDVLVRTVRTMLDERSSGASG